MAAFKKLIFIQLMAWLILVTAGCYFISQNFDSAIGNAQKNAQATVEQYIKNLSATDISADNLKSTLATSETFSRFTLRDYQGAEVFSISNTPKLPFIAELIQSNYNSVRPQYATNNNADIKVEFKLNIAYLADQFQTAFFYCICYKHPTRVDPSYINEVYC